MNTTLKVLKFLLIALVVSITIGSSSIGDNAVTAPDIEPTIVAPTAVRPTVVQSKRKIKQSGKRMTRATAITYTEPVSTESIPSTEPTTASTVDRSSIEATEPTTDPYITLTDDEIYLFATLVYLEGGAESYECQKAIASVVVNRMTTQNKSLYDVIYAPNQFSVARALSYNQPSESSQKAVNEVIENGPSVPEYVTYFRADYYHSWSSVSDYTCIDNTYFSCDNALKEKLK